MRKITGVLVGVALVLMVGSANAADNGTGDPLGLIASGVIQPFWSAGPDNTLIEVTSPLDDNDLHVVYFNSACNRLTSKDKFISRKGAIVFSPDVDLFGLGTAGDVQGLAVITRTLNNITGIPIPDEASIHVNAFWFNLLGDFIRVADPIAVSSTESGFGADRQTYSPLRSAASFVAPRDVAPFITTIHLICPNSQVYSVLPVAAGFPSAPTVATTLTGFLYDDDENFLLDFSLTCTCSSMFQLSTISPFYGVFSPSFLTYTELVTYNVVGAASPPPVAFDPPAFTGYRAVGVIGVLDGFGRLANGAAFNYRNAGDDTIGLFAPNFTPGLR